MGTPIYSLSSVTTLTGADFVPCYPLAEGDARKITVTNFKAIINDGQMDLATVQETTGQKTFTGGFVFPTSTTAKLSDATDAINTEYKVLGKAVWDTTSNRLMIASGTSATSDWERCDSGASVTPS